MKDYGRLLSLKWILTSIVVLLGAAVCVRLGIWQLDRLAQRRASNSHYLLMKTLEPLELPTSEDLPAMEYRRVTATGTFDFTQQIAIRNQYYDDQYGYHLLTPLILDNNFAVLVDRGWIPAEGNDKPAAWSRYNEIGPITVQGIVRLSRAKADFFGKTDPELAPGQDRLDVWTYPNIPRIQNQTKYILLPVYIQLDPDMSDATPPIPYQPEVDLTEGPHLGYALQWFTFAGILLFGYPFFIKKQLGSPRGEPQELKAGIK